MDPSHPPAAADRLLLNRFIPPGRPGPAMPLPDDSVMSLDLLLTMPPTTANPHPPPLVGMPGPHLPGPLPVHQSLMLDQQLLLERPVISTHLSPLSQLSLGIKTSPHDTDLASRPLSVCSQPQASPVSSMTGERARHLSGDLSPASSSGKPSSSSDRRSSYSTASRGRGGKRGGAAGAGMAAAAAGGGRSRRVTHVCDICKKEFHNSSAFAKHKITHQDERKYQCDKCGKNFKRQDHLNGHKLVHEEKKPHACRFCDKSYADSRSLHRHYANTHTDQYHLWQRAEESRRKEGGDADPDNPLSVSALFRCSECEKAFRSQAALNGHMRLHGGYVRGQEEANAEPPLASSSPLPSEIHNWQTQAQYSPITPAMEGKRMTFPPPAELQEPTRGDLSDLSLPMVEADLNQMMGEHSFTDFSELLQEHPGGGSPLFRGGQSVNNEGLHDTLNTPPTAGLLAMRQQRTLPVGSDWRPGIANSSLELTSDPPSSLTLGPLVVASSSSSTQSDSLVAPLSHSDTMPVLTPQNSFLPPTSASQEEISLPSAPTLDSPPLLVKSEVQSPGLSKSWGGFLPPLPGPPSTSLRKRNRPAPLVIPPAAGPGYISHMRSPRLWDPSASAPSLGSGEQPAYTPPPMLSPVRKGSGLYFNLFVGGPRSAPVTPKQLSIGASAVRRRMSGEEVRRKDEEDEEERKEQPQPPQQQQEPLLQQQQQQQEEDVEEEERPVEEVMAEQLEAEEVVPDENLEPVSTEPHINVGDQFQAILPDLIEGGPTSQNVSRSEHADLVWNPDCLKAEDDDQLEHFLRMSCSAAIRECGLNLEYAFHLLYLAHGDFKEASINLLKESFAFAVPLQCLNNYHYAETEAWSTREIQLFVQSLVRHEKDFFMISRDLKEQHGVTKSVKACVEFYYLWKMSGSEDYRRVRHQRRKKYREANANPAAAAAPPPAPTVPTSISLSNVSVTGFFGGADNDSQQYNLRRRGGGGAECEHCGLTFATSRLLDAHICCPPLDFGLEELGINSPRSNNSRSVSPAPAESDVSLLDTSSETVSGFPCRLCGKVFIKVKSRNAHMKWHSEKTRGDSAF